MNPTTIDKLEALFSRLPILVGGSVPEEEIELAERAVGARFDPNYRWFLARYGGAMVGNLPILGLRKAEVMGEDLYSVVEVTQRFRRDGWQPTQAWVVVSVDGSGNPIGIADDGRAWISDHDTGEVKVVASSFEDLLLTLLDRVRAL